MLMETKQILADNVSQTVKHNIEPCDMLQDERTPFIMFDNRTHHIVKNEQSIDIMVQKRQPQVVSAFLSN
jgi:hypothetical protein